MKSEIRIINDRLSNVEKNKEIIQTTKEQDIVKETNNIEEPKVIHKISKRINLQRWYTNIDLCVKNEFKVSVIALVDSGADMNCIQEGIISTKYYQKTAHRLSGAGGSPLNIKYKVSDVHICKNDYCYNTSLILVKNLKSTLILGQPFITQLYHFIGIWYWYKSIR